MADFPAEFTLHCIEPQTNADFTIPAVRWLQGAVYYNADVVVNVEEGALWLRRLRRRESVIVWQILEDGARSYTVNGKVLVA